MVFFLSLIYWFNQYYQYRFSFIQLFLFLLLLLCFCFSFFIHLIHHNLTTTWTFLCLFYKCNACTSVNFIYLTLLLWFLFSSIYFDAHMNSIWVVKNINKSGTMHWHYLKKKQINKLYTRQQWIEWNNNHMNFLNEIEYYDWHCLQCNAMLLVLIII